MIALNISAGTSGYFLGRMVRYKLLPICALTVSISATIALALWVDRLSLLGFEILLTGIGVGFGPAPGLAQVALQNSVERHQLGVSVGTMNFCRNLLGTMLIALFGVIVAGSASVATGASPGSLDVVLNPEAALAAKAFRRVFFLIAGTLTVALTAILLLEEKPLQTGVAPETK